MSDEPISISIINGHLIDPANGIDEQLDLHISQGEILAIGNKPSGFEAERIIDASGQVVCPGLIDLSARLREPGFEYKGNIASETRAAAKGGITTLICPPDTDPVIDTPAVVELIRRRAKQSGHARVLTVGALTKELAGQQISEMVALKQAGCVAVGNACAPIENTLIERRALEYAATFDIKVFLKPDDRHLSNNGCVHEGMVSARMGLPGIPEAAETVAIARDIALAETTGAHIHFRGLSTAAGISKIRRACHDGVSLTADVAAHQLHLTEMDINNFNSECHVLPPLRTLRDRDALRQAVADGSISAICSDHQPHEPDAKELPFPDTEAGISSLETLLPLTLKLVQENVLDLPQAIARLTIGPAQIASLPYGRLDAGSSADICIFDPNRVWSLQKSAMLSQGKNTPFEHWEFTGQVTHTLFEGRITYQLEQEHNT
ncbi:MAG: dihydroorotase [Chromatiales bacterium]|jgi:dihydroorotase